MLRVHGFEAVVGVLVVFVLLAVVVQSQVWGAWPGRVVRDDQILSELRDLELEVVRRDSEICDLREALERINEASAARRMEELVENEVYTWWQWLFSRRKGQEPESAPLEVGCSNIRCCVVMLVDLSLQSIWYLVTDPMRVISTVSAAFRMAFRHNVSRISAIFGSAVMFVVINLLLYACAKFRTACRKIRAAVKVTMGLPVIKLIRSLIAGIVDIVAQTSDHEESRHVVSPVKERLEDLKTIVDRMKAERKKGPEGGRQQASCEFCGKSGHSQERCFAKKRKDREEKMIPKASPVVRGEACSCCGVKGHGIRSCERCEKEVKVVHGEKVPALPGSGDEPQKLDMTKATEREKGRIVHKESLKAGTRLMRDDNQLFTPLWIRTKGDHYAMISKIDRALIDTGSQVDMIPLNLVTKYGLPMRLGSTCYVAGFNGAQSKVVGSVECTVRFGPNKAPTKIEFVVCSDASQPVIGLQTLSRMGYAVDCGNGYLTSTETGEVVKCKVVKRKQKN